MNDLFTKLNPLGMKSIFALALTSVFVLGCSADSAETQIAKEATTKVAVDERDPKDSEVIDAVVDSFFEKTDWNDEWSKGDTLVISPQWNLPGRPDFDKVLAGDVSNAEFRKEADVVKRLNEFKKSTGKATQTPLPDVVSPEKLTLEPRAYVASLKEYEDIFDFRQGFESGKKIKRDGKETAVRGPVWFESPPAYSADGQHAIITAGVPWSMHHAEITFYLNRNGEKWDVFYARKLIYP